MHFAFFLFSISKRKVRRLLAFNFLRHLSGNSSMRILNVAEKNDAAKNIAALLSGGNLTKRDGFSKFNKIYEFEYETFGQNAKMVMTSVRGHLLSYDFTGRHSKWNFTDPISLFEAPVKKMTLPDSENIKKTLEHEIKSCSKLIIWTDCDREGENIGFEVIQVCKGVKRDIGIYRAVFSEITVQSVRRALRMLQAPQKNISDAVDVRTELDLRIGAAFTRLQTLYLQKSFPNVLSKNLISYGSCQFPTLGFVVERFNAISEFKPETFWQLSVQHAITGLLVEFSWKRNRLFDKLACEVLFDKCAECGEATVENVENHPKTKWRPRPMDTIELQKLASRKFRMTATEALKIAENLYTRGLISYPRTETNCFSKEIDLVSLVQLQTDDALWGGFARKVLTDGPDPFQGRKSDQAHPPIHPIKHCQELTGGEKKVYELIVRHFLACLSKHAEGLETTVDVDVAGEKFSAKGLRITARNYLDVYPYETWNEKEIHPYRTGEVFKPRISMTEGETAPPELLTEADLISLMVKHGIGTDATHAEHIEKVKARLYVGLQNKIYFVPRTLGMGLVEGYNSMGYPMAKPEMRAELEADLKKICEGQKSSTEVLATHIGKYKKVYEGVQKQMVHLSRAIESYIQVEATPVDSSSFQGEASASLGKCPTCHSDLVLKKKKDDSKYIGCTGFPECRVALWLPSFVLDVSATTDTCPTCGPNQLLLRFKFREGSCYLPSDHVGCIGGCDWNFLELLNFSGPTGNVNNRSTRTRSDFGSSDESLSARFVAEASPPKCNCGLPAVSFAVKSGPNEGREFYKCALRSSSRCDFFQWKTSIGEGNVDFNRRSANAGEEDMRCYCSLPCRRSVTSKGQNKGRVFLACGKSFRDPDKCKFFKWADDHGSRSYETIRGRATLGHDRMFPFELVRTSSPLI